MNADKEGGNSLADEIRIENSQPDEIKIYNPPPTEIKAEDKPQLSKRQQKRLLKQAKWQAGKIERRLKEKAKKKAKRARIAEEMGVDKINDWQMKHRGISMAKSNCKVTIVVDCDYDEFMNEGEIKKLVKQLNRCYAMNRHSRQPVQLHITSITGRILAMMKKNQSGYLKWDAHCTDKHWTEVFGVQKEAARLELPANLYYLTGDSQETVPGCREIREKNNYIFIIGGIIDHNRHKGLALQKAIEAGALHGQLPIGEHIKLAHRKILSIPHVFGIMQLAAFSEGGTEGKDWKEIFEAVIPSRKFAKEDAVYDNSNDVKIKNVEATKEEFSSDDEQ